MEWHRLPISPKPQALPNALDRDEQLFDRLSAQSPAFRKFARVLMRDDVAPRLALVDIANMAGVPATYVKDVALGATPAPVPPVEEPEYRDARGQAPAKFDADAAPSISAPTSRTDTSHSGEFSTHWPFWDHPRTW